MAKIFETLESVPEVERDIMFQLENSRHSAEVFYAVQRLGALAFRSKDTSEAEILQTRAQVHADRLYKKSKGSNNELPTQVAIMTKTYHNLQVLMSDLYVYKEISRPVTVQQAYREFLTGIKIQARRARPFLARGYPHTFEDRHKFGELAAAFNINGLLGLSLRDIAKRNEQSDTIYLPSFIDTPLVAGKENKATVHPWHYTRFKKDINAQVRMEKRIYVRAEKGFRHDLKLDPNTSVVWVYDDLCGGDMPKWENDAVTIDLLLDMEKETGNDPILDKRAKSVRRAIATRTIGRLIANRELPQLHQT